MLALYYITTHQIYIFFKTTFTPVFPKVGGGAPLGVLSHVMGVAKHEVRFAVVYLHNIND